MQYDTPSDWLHEQPLYWILTIGFFVLVPESWWCVFAPGAISVAIYALREGLTETTTTEKAWRPPTTDERAAAALERYEHRVRLLETAKLQEIEIDAARERLRQQYLQELEELIK